MTTALIVVDVQNDFCEGGALGVEGGKEVARNIAQFVGPDFSRAKGHGFDYVIATRDAHIDPGSHFSSNPDYVDSWPRHCVVGTPGQEFNPNVAKLPFDAVFDKGAYDAGYSGFEGHADGVSMHEWLETRGVGIVHVVGIAYDYCVRATALDAERLGYHTTVRSDLSAAVNPGAVEIISEELKSNGVLVLR